MAGSSSDLHSVSQIWLTASKVLELNFPHFPKTRMGVQKYFKRHLRNNPSAVRCKGSGKGGPLEYRADLLPIHAQKALLALLPDSPVESPVQSPVDFFEQLYEASGFKLFSSPAEMAEDGLNLLSVLSRLLASDGHYLRAELSEALFLAEGLIRAGHALSKTDGGAA